MKSAWQLTMRILGCMKGNLLLLMTLGIIMDSSIASQIPPAASPTLEESTSCRSENQKEESVELQASQTGSSITEVLTSLNEILEILAERISEERSSPSIQQSEEQIMRRQDNSF